jgi:cytosine permease
MVEKKESLFKRLETQYYDFDIEHVPQEERKGAVGLIIVWFCWAFQFATIISGGVLAAGLTLNDAFWAIIIGDIILGIFAVIMSNIGLREGIGFSLQTRYCFGKKATVIPSFIAGCVQLGWLFFCYWIFANVFQVLFTIISPGWGTAGFFIGMIVCTVITVVPVVYGYEGPKWVAYLSVIFLVIPIAYLISVLLGNAGGLAQVAATYKPKQPVSFVFGITLVIGAWIFGAITSADWIRLGRSKWALLAPPIGLVIGESLVLILAAVTVAATMGATWNPIEATLKLGTFAAIVCCIMYLFAMWDTQAPTAWSASLQFANVFWRPKTLFAIILSFLAPLLAILIQYSTGAFTFMNAWLQTLASLVPPVGGILACEYYILNKMKKYPDVSTLKRDVNLVAFLVWILAGLFNYWTNELYKAAGPGVGLTYGIPGVNGFIAAIILYWVIMSIVKKANPAWAQY